MVGRHWFPFSTLLLSLLAFFVIVGGGCTSRAKVTVPPEFRAPDQETIYIAPFTATLVPDSIAEPVFNEFVDTLNRNRTIPGVTFFAIIKDDLKDVEPAWLQKQLYITGELWSYMEKSGCCSTEMRVKSRLRIHQPGQQRPVEIEVPKEVFFEHDRSSIEEERDRFANSLATELSQHVIRILNRKQ